jgi:hypothetical protein
MEPQFEKERMMPMSKTLTTSIVTQRDKKGRGFMRKVGAAYDRAGLGEERAQSLNENPVFDKKLKLLIEECSRLDNRFKFVTTFDIVVPDGYDHAMRLDTFRAEHDREFYYYNPAITDANYAKATNKLVSGRKMKCKVFWINERVSSDDCLGFLMSQEAVLTGAQGVSIAYEQGKDKLPKGRYYASFDEKDALWEDSGGNHRVPSVNTRSDGDFSFDFGLFEFPWDDDHGLLCFCDED